MSSVIRPSENRLQHRGRSSIRRAIFTRSCARRSDTPAFHCTQCSSDLIPWPRQPSAASSTAIVRTRSAVARLIVPISAIVCRSPSRHAASCAGPNDSTNVTPPTLRRGCDSPGRPPSAAVSLAGQICAVTDVPPTVAHPDLVASMATTRLPTSDHRCSVEATRSRTSYTRQHSVRVLAGGGRLSGTAGRPAR